MDESLNLGEIYTPLQLQSLVLLTKMAITIHLIHFVHRMMVDEDVDAAQASTWITHQSNTQGRMNEFGSTEVEVRLRIL